MSRAMMLRKITNDKAARERRKRLFERDSFKARIEMDRMMLNIRLGRDARDGLDKATSNAPA